MGRRGSPAEFLRKVLTLVQAGHSVVDVARDPDMSTETIYAWRHRGTRGDGAGVAQAVFIRRAWLPGWP
ncbi:transposase [Nocardiopsis tropica]|uniref:transposase n=1 Tax=Nocardiopsis tropica TaxID=109330 RepID=UPI0033709EA8